MAKVFVPRERLDGEGRVAATPETVKKLIAKGLSVSVEAGAGSAARFSDQAYRDAGATIVDDAPTGWSAADLVAKVSTPAPDEVACLGEGAILVSHIAAHRHTEVVRALAQRKVATLAMELVPRVTRAQRMDALSSQANLAGYRAVIEAAYRLDKHFPLAMTAAGTIRPANVVVLGAGVAGLQAVATAKRLGAIVRVSDIRAAAKSEVESLGAEFITPPEIEGGEAEGGYAKEVDADYLARQQEQLAKCLEVADAVISTAAVPGRRAPVLITQAMVARMKPGSVIIDLAAIDGGNCALTDPDKEIEVDGVRIVPAGNLPATMPGEASALYARNVLELLGLLVGEGGELHLDREDDIIAAALLTVDGEVTHARTRELLGEPPLTVDLTDPQPTQEPSDGDTDSDSELAQKGGQTA